MINFSDLVSELRKISSFAYCIETPIYYWSVDEDGITGMAIRSNALSIPLSLSTEEKQDWCNKLNAVTKEIHTGSIFSLVGPNNKISMIKELRTAMNLGLKEAKEMVEDYLSTGKMKTLSFILYSGVPELEGYGYFPFCENQPCPIEMAEVLGYSIASEKQYVSPCTHWGVVFFLGSYLIVPHFPEDAALGWDGDNVIRVEKINPDNMLYSCGSKKEADEIALLMNNAYRKGIASAVDKMMRMIDNLH